MSQTYVVAPTTDKGAISHLFDNLDLIITNKNKILFYSKYRNIKIPGLYVSGLYIGTHELSLGDILRLWDKTEWHTGAKYYFNIIGTPLSGMNTANLYNSETKQFESGTYFNGKLHFLGLAKPALEYLTNRTNILCTHTKQKSQLSIFDLVKQLQH